MQFRYSSIPTFQSWECFSGISVSTDGRLSGSSTKPHVGDLRPVRKACKFLSSSRVDQETEQAATNRLLTTVAACAQSYLLYDY